MPTKPKHQRRKTQRGPAVLIRITWPVVADLLGVNVATAKRWGNGPKRRFDPRDLRSILEYRERVPKHST